MTDLQTSSPQKPFVPSEVEGIRSSAAENSNGAGLGFARPYPSTSLGTNGGWSHD